LLLVDGRRSAATDPTGDVDINVIPAGLIARLEIVTGGAPGLIGRHPKDPSPSPRVELAPG